MSNMAMGGILCSVLHCVLDMRGGGHALIGEIMFDLAKMKELRYS